MALAPRARRPSRLAPLSAAAAARWAAMSARERRLVAAALLVVGGAVLWLLLLRPALRVEAQAPQRIQQLRAALAQAQAQADELARLAALPARHAQTDDPAGALRQWLQQHGGKAQVVALPGAVNVELRDLPAPELAELARTARRDWGLQVSTAKLQLDGHGALSGSLQLQASANAAQAQR